MGLVVVIEDDGDAEMQGGLLFAFGLELSQGLEGGLDDGVEALARKCCRRPIISSNKGAHEAIKPRFLASARMPNKPVTSNPN